MLTEYGAPALADSFPVATCCPAVVKVMAGLQAPEVPPVTLLHVAVTAEVGTVAQPVNEAAPACTFKFQVLPVAPLEVVQLTVDAELPETLTKSGSVAVKLIVPGAAETDATLAAGAPAKGLALAARATMRDFCGTGATWAAVLDTPRHKNNSAVNAMRFRCPIVLPLRSH